MHKNQNQPEHNNIQNPFLSGGTTLFDKTAVAVYNILLFIVAFVGLVILILAYPLVVIVAILTLEQVPAFKEWTLIESQDED